MQRGTGGTEDDDPEGADEEAHRQQRGGRRADETTAAAEETGTDANEEPTDATPRVDHDLETQRGRLCAAIEQHGPGQRTVREFHRAVRAHIRGVTGSYHAVAGYVEGARPIPDKFLEAAAKVLGPVTSSWL